MAPTKSKKSKAKPTVQRKSSRRNAKNVVGNSQSTQDKENELNGTGTTASSQVIQQQSGTNMSRMDDAHEKSWVSTLTACHPLLYIQLSNDFHVVYIDNVQWSLHVEKAASLVEKCMKQYNWSRADTKNVLNAYRQLLLLKKEMTDWNATKLSPCWPVAQMWLQHRKVRVCIVL